MIMRTPTAAILLMVVCGTVEADAIRVGAGNFVRAETDTYMATLLEGQTIGGLRHSRTPTPLDEQSVIRMNRDTLYSSGVFDLDAGAVTVHLPDTTDGRYMAAQVLSQDHYTIEVFHQGSRTFDRDAVGTRYAVVLFRTFVDANNPADIQKANSLQDAIRADQPETGAFEVPVYDQASLTATREALLTLGNQGQSGLGKRMGSKGEVDPISHLIATAAGWGLNPESEATYVFGLPEKNDGKMPYTLELKDVPVDGFWSVTVYDAGGFMFPNALGINSINNVTGVMSNDGGYRIQFGDCGQDTPNCLPITEGWNYVIRLYRPRESVLNMTWVAPDSKPFR